MSITAVSADGVNHVFPDGTSTDVIGKVMKQYALTHQPTPANDQSAGTSQPGIMRSAMSGALQGVEDIGLGTAQLAGNILVPPNQTGITGLNDEISGKRSPYNKFDPGGWIQNEIGRGITAADAAAAPAHAAHPIATDIGEVAGQVPGIVAPESYFGDAAAAASWLGRMKTAARIGTEVGAEGSIDPSRQGAAYWTAKAKNTAEDIGGSIALGQAGEGLNAVSKAIGGTAHGITDSIYDWLQRNDPDANRVKAVKMIKAKLDQDERGGGPTAKDIIDIMRKGHDAGVPTSLMEAGGANLKGLTGSVARSKGPARQIIANSFADRLGGARQRLLGSVQRNFNAPETMRQVRGALSDSQRVAAKPLYDKAFQPGSLAPLKVQFEKAFDESSRVRKEAYQTRDQATQAITSAAAKLSRAGDDVYLNSSARDELRAAQANLDDADSAVERAESMHQDNLDLLQQAQQAEAAGERGGVWSPHIGRLTRNPDVRKGINTGLHIIRNEADARNEPFNPTDYGITGYDEHGEPIVSKVPNMRVLDAGKRGLDKILEDFRSPITGRLELNQYGRSIDELRRALLSEMDRINPDYKPARQVWAGPAASKGAMAQGTKIFTMHPEDVKAVFDHMSPAEREHFRIGAAQAYLDAIGHKGVVAAQVRDLAEDDTATIARQRLMPIFKNQRQLDEFIAAVEGERGIYNTKQAVIGNSATAARTADDTEEEWEAGIHAAHGAAHAASGNFIGAARSFLRARRNLGMMQNPQVNAEIARLLSDPQTDIAGIINGTQPKDIPTEPDDTNFEANAPGP